MNLQDVKCEGTDWIDLAQDRDWWQDVVKERGNALRVPYNAGNFLTS